MASPLRGLQYSTLVSQTGRAFAPKRPLKIGIRAEDPARIWERRAPLTPEAVHDLISSGSAEVDVVSCTKRVFPDEEYRKAGANIVHKLNPSSRDPPQLVLGIKESPLDEVHNGLGQGATTHMMFSHTAKGQLYNMPLLSKFADKHGEATTEKPRLLDYELLMDKDTGRRTVAFGWYAGVAGVLEALSSLGQYYLERGIATPFLYTPRPHTRPTLNALKEDLRAIGRTIRATGLPTALGPCIIGVTGSGQVAQGALDMLKALDVTPISLRTAQDMLIGTTNKPSANNMQERAHSIYVVHVKPEDYLVKRGANIRAGPTFDRSLYYASPDLFESVFSTEVAPYLSLLINGTGWSPGFPRLMTTAQLLTALGIGRKHPGFRGCNIADISCDVGGGLEFMNKATTLSSPFYKLDGLPSQYPSVQIMSVDILPASIPEDASKHFSGALMPYISQHLAWSAAPETPYPDALANATIAVGGLLTKNHKWLYGQMTSSETEQAPKQAPVAPSVRPSRTSPVVPQAQLRKKILILGSGMVAQPAVDMIAQRKDVDLIIASNNVSEMRALTKPYPKVKWHSLDFYLAQKTPRSDDTGAQGGVRHERELYESLIRASDVVISLLPAPMHPSVAEACIKFKTHLVTASYISEKMSSLHDKAKDEDILLLNEIGLDPGIDHCSACDLIDRLHRDKKTIESFISFCGGLPAPEFSHVPLRYKFSWRPQGVLFAALNEAEYRLSREHKHVPGRFLLGHVFPSLPISSDFNLEGLPNRDSLAYIPRYRIPKEPLRTFVRGTLRYPGFSLLMGAFAKVGLLDTRKSLTLTSWQNFVPQTVELNPEFDGSISSLLNEAEVQVFHEALEYLGLAKSYFETANPSMPPLPAGSHTPLELFAYLLSHKLKYQPGEQDMVVLAHEIKTRDMNGLQEVHSSTLISYGTQVADMFFKGERPASAMARTVGYPVAIAALLIIDDAIALRGVHAPLRREVYEPVLKALDKVGIRMVENTRPIRRDIQTLERALIPTTPSRNTSLHLVQLPLDHPDIKEKDINFED